MQPDPRIEKHMPNIGKAIRENLPWPSNGYTRIYNAAYSAIARAISETEAAAKERERTLQSELWAERAQYDLCKERERTLREKLNRIVSHYEAGDLGPIDAMKQIRSLEYSLNRGKED